jgi:hypothetical protein
MVKFETSNSPSIRYFAYYISKCVLARKNASKLSVYDLAFLSAALRCDRTYNLGAMIAFRLSTNREKGGVCGGLIASRLLAMHGVGPHHFDIQLPIERLDLNSMISHQFISRWSTIDNLSYELVFVKKTRWRTKTYERIVCLPAPLLFNLDVRQGWSFSEGDLDAYMEEHGLHADSEGGGPEEDFIQPFDTTSSSYQDPDYDHARYDPPGWSSGPCG